MRPPERLFHHRRLRACVAVCLVGLAARGAPEEPGPRPACVAPDTCTLVRPVARAEGVETVAFTDRPPVHADPSQPFAGWMPWLHAPEKLRTRAWHGESVRIERVTEAGTFLLRVVPGVRVADEADALLVLVLVDPLRTGTPAGLPEPIAIARERKLLTPEQERQAERESQAQRGRARALTNAWLAFARAPAERTARARLLESIANDATALDPASFLTPAQRTALRQAGLALEGRIVLEDGGSPAVAFRLRVEAVPLEQVAREWNAGLRALVNPLERVPRPLLLVTPGHRHDEVSFTLDVLEGDEDRMSQVARRLLAIPGLSTDGKQLPPPAL
jgi:hypothetical protein